MKKMRFLAPAAGLVLAVSVLPTSQSWAQPDSPAASAADCGPGLTNPQTDNVTDYRTDTNVVAAGRWSYQNVGSDTPTLLKKGGTGVFAADEWEVDPTKPEHAWYVKADGSIGTDWKPIAEVYTVPDTADGKSVHIAGTFSSPGGRFRILLAHDGNANVTAGPFTQLFTYTGVSATFDLTQQVSKGDDLIFVSDGVSTWWVAGKLRTTITTLAVPQTAAVTASPGPGAVTAGTSVALASPTPGACISYTTDGSDPRSSATRRTYTGPLTIAADTDVKAVAVAAGQQQSDVTDAPFVLSEPFRSFVGVNQGSITGEPAGAQWGRQDFDWQTLEPTKGQVNQAALAEYVRQFTVAKQHGITILPVLAYTADWAANRTGYTYTFHDTTYQYGPVLSESKGTFTRHLTTTDSTGHVLTSADVTTSAGRTPPENVSDWTDFVKLAVATLKPLGISYFQVWNEAYPGSGFWEGGMDEYMQTIQLPAAEVIHDAGAKVVYGGWICGAPLSEYIALLDKWHAWESVDVLDMHYMPLGTLQTLYRAAKDRGVKSPAIWQTELGFTTEDKFIADVYPRAFHWALSNGGDTSWDQFKLIYFAEWAPNDPAAYGYNRTLRSGNALSAKGQTLTTLASLLRGTKVRAYDSFTTDPQLGPELNENLSTANGFRLDDKRVVLAIDLKRQNQADIFEDPNTGDTIHLSFGNPTMTVTFRDLKDVSSVDRVDLYGNRTPLAVKDVGRGLVQVEVPIIDPDPTVRALNRTENEDVFYLALTQR